MILLTEKPEDDSRSEVTVGSWLSVATFQQLTRTASFCCTYLVYQRFCTFNPWSGQIDGSKSLLQMKIVITSAMALPFG